MCSLARGVELHQWKSEQTDDLKQETAEGSNKIHLNITKFTDCRDKETI